MKLAIFETIILFLSLFIAYILLGMEGAILSTLGSIVLVLLMIIITVAIKRIIFRNKKLSYFIEYSILVLVLFLFLFILFELGGLQSIISIFYGSIISLIIVLIVSLIIGIFELESFFTSHKKKTIRLLHRIIVQDKELSVLFFIITLLTLTLFTAYIFAGRTNSTLLLIPLMFFIMGLILFVVLDIKFYKKNRTLLNNFEKVIDAKKLSFNLIIGALLSLFLILFVFVLINEYHFSINSEAIYPKQIGGVDILPYPNGAKTVVIFTNDDVGVSKYSQEEFKDIVDVHVNNNISGTFFVVLEDLNNWENTIKYAIENGQNLEFHSYSHNLFESGYVFYFIDYPSYAHQKEMFEKSNLMNEKIGVKPLGFRPTIWADNKYTLQLLDEFGFEYLSDRLLLLTPRFPYYRVIDNKISNILTIPATLEFNFFFGPPALRRFLLDFNLGVTYLFLEKHKEEQIPFVLVTHTGRFSDTYAFTGLDKVMKLVNEDPELVVMNMAEYNNWVRAYEKVEVIGQDGKILIRNGFPGLVVSYNGQRYNVDNATNEI